MATLDKPTSGSLKSKYRWTLAFLLLVFALLNIALWSARLATEPTRYLPPITEQQGPSFEYGYNYETASRDWSNRRFYLCIVNTLLEIPLVCAFAYVAIQYVRRRLQAGALLLVFLVETIYWAASFSLGMTFSSYVDITAGGALMGLCVVVDICLLVAYGRQKKNGKVNYALSQADASSSEGSVISQSQVVGSTSTR